MARLRVARAARRDLDEIADYLRIRSPAAALRIGAAIVTKIDTVVRFPEIGPVVEQRGHQQHRRTVSGDYVIWYRVDADSSILILGVRHGRRRPLSEDDLDVRNQPAE